MAFCTKCGGVAKQSDRYCSACGAPISGAEIAAASPAIEPSDDTSGASKVIAAIAIIVVLLVGFTIFPTLGSWSLRSEAKSAIRSTLVDPDSAQFRDVADCPASGRIIEGEYNARNRAGGYQGFVSFFYRAGKITTAGDTEFMKILNICYGKS